MKRKILFVVLVFCFLACGKPNGELVNPPEGLEQSIKDYCVQKGWQFHGLSVRAYPNDAYLVTIDHSSPMNPTSPTLTRTAKQFIAEKGAADGAQYWQITFATKEKMKVLGIKTD